MHTRLTVRSKEFKYPQVIAMRVDDPKKTEFLTTLGMAVPWS